jgi:hypothetical protein
MPLWFVLLTSGFAPDELGPPDNASGALTWPLRERKSPAKGLGRGLLQRWCYGGSAPLKSPRLA